MIYTLPAYGLPRAVCARPASKVVVRDDRRHIHHVQGAKTCAVGNEVASTEPRKAQEAEA